MRGMVRVPLAVLCVLITHWQTTVDSSWEVPTADPGSFESHAESAAKQRLKREAKKKLGFNATDKQQVVRLHNKLRHERKSSNMRFVYWDPALEYMAQNWADKCLDSPRPVKQRKNGEFSVIGENMYVASAFSDVKDVVNFWVSQKDTYNYTSATCERQQYCEDYKQIMWAKTYALGCGLKFCHNLTNFEYGAYILVCNYGPGGNEPGVRPYKEGTPCSECDPKFPTCFYNLCRKLSRASRIATSHLFIGYCLMWCLAFSLERTLLPW